MKKESEYQETLHLPVTDFPMRGNLPKGTSDAGKMAEEDYYGRLQELRRPREANLYSPRRASVC